MGGIVGMLLYVRVGPRGRRAEAPLKTCFKTLGRGMDYIPGTDVLT